MKVINIKGTRTEKCIFSAPIIMDIESEETFRKNVALSDSSICAELDFNIHHEEPEFDYRIDEYELVDEARGNYVWPASRDGEGVTISTWYQITAEEFHALSSCMEDTFQASDDDGIIRYYKYEVTCFEPEVGERLDELLNDYVDEARANGACRLEILDSPYLEGTYWKYVRKPVTSE